MNWIYWIFLVLGILWMLGNVLTGPLQHWFIMRPKKSRPETKYHFPDLFREVFLESGPGTKFHSLWFQTKNRPPRGVVLYLHGNAGSLERWGEIGPRFTQLGFDILIPDYRGYGKSTGPQSEKAFYQDADSCWKFLEENYPKVPKIIFGRSIGSGPACWLAAHTNPNGLILETPFPSMKKLFYSYYPFLPRLFFFRFTFSNIEYLKQCKMPILVFAGTRDWVVPFRCSKQLKTVLKPTDLFIAIPGGRHSHLNIFPEYKDNLEKWFQSVE